MARNALHLVATLLCAAAIAAGDLPPRPEPSVEPDEQARTAPAAARGPMSHARVKVALPPAGGKEIREMAADARAARSEPPPVSEPVISTPLSREKLDGLENRDSAGGYAPAKPPEPRVLAMVGDMAITDHDVLRELWESRGPETLEWMIGKAILDRELLRLGLSVDDGEVEERLASHLSGLRRAFPNLGRPDDLTRSVSGMRLDEYRKRTVWAELALRKIMRASLKPGDEQLRAYFAERQADFIRPERVRISQIFIAPRANPENGGAPGPADWAAAEKQILEAHSRLRAGDDFAAVARAYGAGGQQSRWVKRGELLRELEDAAFSLRPDSLSGPIRSGMGYHIIRTEEKHERVLPRFEEVREEVREQYEEKRFVVLAGEFMNRLRERALKGGDLIIGAASGMFAGSGGEPGTSTY